MGDPGQEQASKRRKKHLNGGFFTHIIETGIEGFFYIFL
jgi:hypothetical protein